MLIDWILRFVILAVCTVAIFTSLQVAVWTLRPIWQPVQSWVTPKAWSSAAAERPVPVSIEPLGLIEGGKLKNIENRALSKRLSHRLEEIFVLLTRNQDADITTLRGAQLQVSDPGERDAPTFGVLTKQNLEFELQVFKFDVAGLVAWARGRLDQRDSVKAMIELQSAQSRIFVDVSRVNGENRHEVEDGPAVLSDSVDRVACAVALAYLRRDGLYQGMTSEQMCRFVTALERYRGFVSDMATRIDDGGTPDLSRIDQIAAPFEAAPLGPGATPASDLILATLYRLDNRPDAALDRLESVAQSVPGNAFVEENLAAWRDEAKDRAVQQAALSQTKQATAAQGVTFFSTETPPGGQQTVPTAYPQILRQPALAAINYPQMIDRLTSLSGTHPVTVALFGTGFTASPTLASRPNIFPAVNVSDDADGTDENGFGNMTTHLLAALLPLSEVSILPIKVLGKTGGGDPRAMVTGARQAIDQGADVFAIPLGNDAPEKGGPGSVYTDDVFALSSLPMLAAAGNTGRDGNINVPAKLPPFFSVGATDAQGGWAKYSPGPAGVDLAFAGTVLTTITGTEERMMNGSSFSTMIAAALFAAALHVNPDLSRDRILELLLETARANADDSLPRRIDALAFIEAVEATRP